jgi:uncharacterized protein YjiK
MKGSPISCDWRLAGLLLLLLLGCTSNAPRVSCGPPRVTGRLPAELREASGIAANSQRDDQVWVITDDGRSTLYSVDTAGRIAARIPLRGVAKYDWESLAAARCGERTCLYVGDIGDNQRDRRVVYVYRVPEPRLDATTTEKAERFAFRYPDGSHDAEALFVMPGQQLFVVTKGRSEPISVYRYPGDLQRDSVATLQLVQQLSESFVQIPDMVTGAGASAEGEWIVLRTYGAVELYHLRAGRLEPQLSEPIGLQSLHEFQGEGVDLSNDGTILLLSEKGLDEVNPPISRIPCALPE